MTETLCLPLAKSSMWGDARGHRKPKYLVFALGSPSMKLHLTVGAEQPGLGGS